MEGRAHSYNNLTLVRTCIVNSFTEQEAMHKKQHTGEQIKEIISMELHDAKKLLLENYKMYLEAHTGVVRSVLISSDDKYIISCSNDTTVRIWSIQEQKQEAILLGHTIFCWV